MQKKDVDRRVLIAGLGGAVAGSLLARNAVAGSLNPTAPPGPTGMDMTQLSQRVASGGQLGQRRAGRGDREPAGLGDRAPRRDPVRLVLSPGEHHGDPGREHHRHPRSPRRHLRRRLPHLRASPSGRTAVRLRGRVQHRERDLLRRLRHRGADRDRLLPGDAVHPHGRHLDRRAAGRIRAGQRREHLRLRGAQVPGLGHALVRAATRSPRKGPSIPALSATRSRERETCSSTTSRRTARPRSPSPPATRTGGS